MALLHIDSFDDGMWNLGKWDHHDGSCSINGTGRLSNGLNTTSYREKALQKYLPDISGTAIAGFAIKANGFGADMAVCIASFWTDNGATRELSLKFATSGVVRVYARDSTLLCESAAGALAANTWHYVEFKGNLHNSTGSVEVRVDGVTVCSASGVDTVIGATTVIDAFALGAMYNFVYVWDDIYVCDTTGTVNNAFLGDITVESLAPSGNGNSSVLVGSDADSTDNYLLVDEATPSTADYVGSATQGDKDTYAMGNIAGTPTSILGLQVNSYVGKSDSGFKWSRPVLRSGTTDYVGSSDPLSTTYLVRADLWELDPDTAVAWTESGVNAIEAGFEVRDS